MRRIFFFLTIATALAACVDTPDPTDGAPPAADTNWTGEVRMTKGDTSIRLCGTGRTYRLSGPDMDTLTYRYVHARMTTGQWMKVWCYGHIGAVRTGELIDSVLFAVKFQHLDASLRCDPIPDARVSGDWKLDEMDPLHPREIHVHLFPDGNVTMITDLHTGLIIEEDGTWGMDVENRVNVVWPQRQQTMYFNWDGTALTNTNGVPGKRVSMTRVGPADRLAGAFGRTARWLAATATAHGRPTRPEDLQLSTPLLELFPTEEARKALHAQALDTLSLHSESAALGLQAAHTVRDYSLMMRNAPRR